MTDTNRNPSPFVRPSPLACTECRNKHLKCDAKQPICSRCTASELQCNYTPSRRGCKGIAKKRRKLNPPTDTQDVVPEPCKRDERAASSSDSSQQIESIDSGLDIATVPDHRHQTSFVRNGALQPACQERVARVPLATPPSFVPQHLNPDDEHIVNLYYTNFHSAHPILLPRHLFFCQDYPPYLKLVVQFIGNHYSASSSADPLRIPTAASLKDETNQTYYMVQARLLFAVALHARNETNEAQAVLSSAIDLAVGLGMNSREFAESYSRHQPATAESLRRTWWELYVADGFLSAIHRKPSFKSDNVALGALLPCEDSIYADGACMSGKFSLAEFNDRHFAEEELSFSSFCYRIEALRILSRVMSISYTEVHPDEVQAIDNSLAAWSHYLPPEKRDIINNFGEVDEMLFQAHMIISCATILLHLPRSDLLAVLPQTSEMLSTAGNDRLMSPTDSKHAHAVKATNASKELSNLAALRCPVQKHSPFFIRGLVLASIVQLSACTLHACPCYEQHRDRITLIVGLLKSLALNWAMAGVVMMKIKKLAAKVLRRNPGDPPSQCASCVDSGFGGVISGVVSDSGSGSGSGRVDEIAVPWLEFFDDPGLTALTQFLPGMMFPGEA